MAAPTPDYVVPLGREALQEFEHIGDYELLEMIGKGAMGRVFKARQVSLNRLVALKILPPALARNQRYTVRFLREAQASGKLQHPNVVQGIDCGRDEDSGLWYLAMEYVDGHSIAAELKHRMSFSEKRTIEIGLAMASALEAAAQQGIVHRDIKPENILISKTGDIKLADLGLARMANEKDASLTRADVTVGTPYYVSPEQARGQRDKVDTRSDIYSLGATLFHIITGRPPYEGQVYTDVMIKHIRERVPLAHHVDPDIGEPISRVIAKMMQKQPAQRYQTPAELRQALERAKLGTTTARRSTARLAAVPQRRFSSRVPAERKPTIRGRKPEVHYGTSQRYLILGVAAILLALIPLGFLLMHEEKPPPIEKKTSEPDTPPQAPPPALPAESPVPKAAQVSTPSVRPVPTDEPTIAGRFVRIELPGERRTLSLAEVQVFVGDKNVALKGKATQSSAYRGAVASRAIDGNTNGNYSRNSVTHTKERSKRPWWEVDLGREVDISGIAVWTRTDGNGQYIGRLAGFTLTILRADRSTAAQIDNVPAPLKNTVIRPVYSSKNPSDIVLSASPGS